MGHGKMLNAGRSLSCGVIGGNGFVGSGIVRAARRAGWAVTVIDRAGYSAASGRPFDVVVNAAGNARRFHANRSPASDFEASCVPVFRSLEDFRAGLYVLVSTVDVYNDPASRPATREDVAIDPLRLCPYGFHRRLAELAVMRRREPWLVLRLGQMVGDGLKKGPLFDLLHGQPLWISPRSRLSFLATDRVGELLVAAVERGRTGEVLNVCGRGSVELARLLEHFAGAFGSPSFAGEELQSYDVDTTRAEALHPLPDSWDEVRSFVERRLAERA